MAPEIYTASRFEISEIWIKIFEKKKEQTHSLNKDKGHNEGWLGTRILGHLNLISTALAIDKINLQQAFMSSKVRCVAHINLFLNLKERNLFPYTFISPLPLPSPIL